MAGKRGWHVAVGASRDDGGVAPHGEDRHRDGDVAAKSSDVCRIRDDSGFEGVESRELSEHDLADRVLRDERVAAGARLKLEK
jgi:hypothetical protein